MTLNTSSLERTTTQSAASSRSKWLIQIGEDFQNERSLICSSATLAAVNSQCFDWHLSKCLDMPYLHSTSQGGDRWTRLTCRIFHDHRSRSKTAAMQRFLVDFSHIKTVESDIKPLIETAKRRKPPKTCES